MSPEQKSGYEDSPVKLERLLDERDGLIDRFDALLVDVPAYDEPAHVGKAAIRGAVWRDGKKSISLSHRWLTTGRIFKTTTDSYELSIQEKLDDDTHIVTEYLYLPYRNALAYSQYLTPGDGNLSQEDSDAYLAARAGDFIEGNIAATNSQLDNLNLFMSQAVSNKPVVVDLITYQPSGYNEAEEE